MITTLQIGPLTYTVLLAEELASETGELHGDINYGKCRIRICADDADQLQHVTLWHEALHGVLHAAGIPDHDESRIVALAHGIVALLRDNPVLAEGLAA